MFYESLEGLNAAGSNEKFDCLRRLVRRRSRFTACFDISVQSPNKIFFGAGRFQVTCFEFSEIYTQARRGRRIQFEPMNSLHGEVWIWRRVVGVERQSWLSFVSEVRAAL